MLKTLERFGAIPGVRLMRPLYRSVLKWIKRRVSAKSRRALLRRWNSRPHRAEAPESRISLKDLPIGVISLPNRKDRLKSFDEEMRKLGLSHHHLVPGVSGRDLYPHLPGDFSGAIGCNLAHSNALEALDWSGEELLMVCEDDVEFQVDTPVLEELISEFKSNPHLDVLCLAGRVRGSKIPISDSLFVVTGVVGQACYVVKPHMVGLLANLWRSGVRDLERLSLRGKNDIIWNRVQTSGYFFAFPRLKVARQRASFSDIQGREMPPQEST